MLRISRDKLSKFNYWFVGLLMIVSLSVVIYSSNPEKLIEGEWKEVGWYFEKPDHSVSRDNFAAVLEDKVRKEILEKLELFHVDVWSFQQDGSLRIDDKLISDNNMQWVIKGRGHILEIRRNGRTIESFQIQELNKDVMELHLNLDIQIKGIVKIVLERKQEEVLHAKKV